MTRFETFRADAAARRDAFRTELARRASLAREARPDGVRGPSSRLLWGELGSIAQMRRRAPQIEPALRPQPVILLPGFGSHPLRMRHLERALRAAGHEVADWGLGFNLGPTQQNFALLLTRIENVSREHGAPVALVGWSLGGLFAREAAKMRPDCVSRVVTLGTPFSGDRRANNAWRAYQFVTGHSVDEPPIPCDFAVKPPVPTTALWSPRDGVVSPRSSCGRKGERDHAVALRCTHIRFTSDPLAIAEVLRQLDRAD
ncbi:MAG: alpha/beta fold hydrolase [Novosphingobium sp.]